MPPVAYLEPTETVAQAPRFARHLIDNRRHVLDFSGERRLNHSWCKRHKMRNPDPYQPPEPQPDHGSATRRAALIGLLMILVLVIGGLFLSHVLRGMTRLQDCALSGRSNCSVNP
jgi:hypothetical protein